MRIRLPAAVLLTLFGAGLAISGRPSAAQSAPAVASSPAMESVAIYVTPVSKKGVPADLQPGDLTITEDKAPATIQQVSCGKHEPILIGILVDVSGSRRGDPHLGSHYDALQVFLDHLLAGDDAAYVIAFDDRLHKLTELTADRVALSATFDKLRKHQPVGSTAMYDAIKAAAGANFFGRRGRRILVVVGDWEDNSSQVHMGQGVEAAQRNSTTIYPIVDAQDGAYFKEKAYRRALSVAKEVAEEAGGWPYDVHSEKEFDAALQAIQVAIGGSCRVEYSVPKGAAANREIKLHVDIHAKDTSISYPRARFNAAP
jgi:VWFA-related protein